MNLNIGQIDLTRELQKVELYLAKPDKIEVSTLKEAYNVTQTLELGQVNEIQFLVPYEVDVNHRLKRNKNIDLLKQRYQIRVKLGDYEEWYVIDSMSDTMDDEKDVKSVTAYSLPYELKGKHIHEWEGIEMADGSFRKESLNLKQVSENIVSQTLWTIGYIDAHYETIYRSFDFSATSALDAIFQIAEKFEAIIKWDTHNRKIDFYKPENVGTNRGLKVKYGKYLQGLNKEEKSDEMFTKLHVYGEGIDIREVNPTGTNVLEDYSYYMYPYKEDELGNTIQSSHYMSDELCKAILGYSKAVESKTGEFNNLLSQKKVQQSDLTSKSSQLLELQEQLIEVQYVIDVKLADSQDVLQERIEEANIESQITAKQNELTSVRSNITNIDTQILTLRQSLDLSNFFTDALLKERKIYEHATEWSDTEEIDVENLYKSAIEAFEEIKVPKTVVDIDIVNFLQVAEAQNDWDKLVLGDKFYIEYEKMGIDSEAQISRVEINHDDQSIDITISNRRDIETSDEKVTKMFYDSISTSSSVSINKKKWDKITEVNNTINKYFDNAIDATKQGIVAGVNESVIIDNRGLTIISKTNPNKFLRGTHGVIAITNDGGNTYKHAITGDGVIGERIIGKILIGNNLALENESGIFRFDGDGVTIEGSAVTFTDGLPESQIDQDAVNKWNNKIGADIDYTNGFRWDTIDGIVVTRSDKKVRTMMNATNGISIQKNNGTAENPIWQNKFFVDTEGNLNTEEMVAKKLTIKNGSDEIMIDGSTGTIDFSKFNTKLGKITSDNIDVSTITIGDANVTGTLSANKLNLKGTDISSALGVFKIGLDGSVTISGNINMQGGSISWGNVGKPEFSYSELTGSKPPSNADNTWGQVGQYLTHITSDGVYTGTVQAEKIIGSVIKGIDFMSMSDNTPFNVYIGSSSNLASQTFYDSFNLWRSGTRYFRVDTTSITHNGKNLATQEWVLQQASGVAKFG
jgi:Prophage endopeptidase tail